MKNFSKTFVFTGLLIAATFAVQSCGDSSTETPTETKDSSILDNYNNGYPNDRIHMQDSNAAADSARAARADSTVKPDSTKK